ncbi:hypothetical protein AB1Y20_007961 [Prymnesium parvum]|uniref:Peptidase S26 domain-containing protein n=1 Tax=Prymnesium parvum TaxID=97485 RepID=A0AB34ITM5_PRYPA
MRRVLARAAARRPFVRRTASQASQGARTSPVAEGTQAAVELLQFGAFALCVNNYVISSTQCVGPSMLPTISSAGDIVLALPVSSFSWSIRPQLGDVVICTSPTDPSQTVCKRVLGMPGDEVHVHPVPGLPRHAPRGVRVPEGRCWLQGDNVYDSTDSRFYGPVPLALVQSVVFFRVWPLHSVGFIPRMGSAEVARLHNVPSAALRAGPEGGHVEEEEAAEGGARPSHAAEQALSAFLAPKMAERGAAAARDELIDELAAVVERARAQACADGANPELATGALQKALADLFDSERRVA